MKSKCYTTIVFFWLADYIKVYTFSIIHQLTNKYSQKKTDSKNVTTALDSLKHANYKNIFFSLNFVYADI